MPSRKSTTGPLTPQQVWTEYPYLWHMATFGSWPSIKRDGLFSTTALLRRYGVSGSRRTAIESQRRPECVTLQADGYPDVIIRDNKPATDGALLKCLEDGLSPTDWYRILNARTFFWLSNVRLRGLLGARAYRRNPQTVLTVDTKGIIQSHERRIELSPINSGSTIYNPSPRGKSTFAPIAEYDYASWRKKRGRRNAIVELVVLESVPDIRDHVVAVHDWVDGSFRELWRRKGVDPAVGP